MKSSVYPLLADVLADVESKVYWSLKIGRCIKIDDIKTILSKYFS